WERFDASGHQLPAQARIDTGIKDIIEAFTKARLSAGFKDKIPAAVVLTKADIFNQAGVLPARLAQSERHLPAPNFTELTETDRLVRGMVAASPDAGFLVNEIAKAFSPVQYFAVSSLGFAPLGEFNREPTPHRVEEPIIWLLKQMGYFAR